LQRRRSRAVELLDAHGVASHEGPLGRGPTRAGICFDARSSDQLEPVVLAAAPQERTLGVGDVDGEAGELDSGARLVGSGREGVPHQRQQGFPGGRILLWTAPAERTDGE
jgi:hypothetical protein